MITGIEIENFKGVGERIRLDLRPITLLFGANSSGKSTCIHALHYAREVFLRGNLDSKETTAGGKFIDLGGFRSLVHGRDLNRSVKIRIDMEPEEHSIGRVLRQNIIDNNYWLRSYPRLGFPSRLENVGLDLSFIKRDAAKTMAVELTVRWSPQKECAYVSSHKTFLDGDLFAEITIDPSLRDVALATNKEHPSLAKLSDISKAPGQQEKEDSENNPTLLSIVQDEIEKIMNNRSRGGLPLRIRELFGNDEPRCIYQYISDGYVSRKVSFEKIKQRENQSIEDYGENRRFVSGFTRSLWKIIFTPCFFLKAKLKSFLYLGPLRETPSRDFQPPSLFDLSHWASGRGAWSALHNQEDRLVELVGDWLGDEDKLNTGYRLERKKMVEFDTADPVFLDIIRGKAGAEEVSDLLLTKGINKTEIVINPIGTDLHLRPHDVGVGISQVVPVVVTALLEKNRLLAIEQPELHLHPKAQAVLADLFIEAALGNTRHLVILETHSEHLVHRFMRRIRETEQKKNDLRRELRTTDIAINYFSRSQPDGSSSVRRIDVDVNGEFIQPWPDDFFDIEFNERFPDAR